MEVHVRLRRVSPRPAPRCAGPDSARRARGDPAGRRARTPTDEPDRRGDRRPPTPAERLGLVEGWGPTAAELERAARHRRPDAAARPRRAGDRRRVARHRGPGRDGAPAPPRRGHRLRRQRRVHPADPRPSMRRWSAPYAARGRCSCRRPGGRHRRAGQGRRDAVPDLHERRAAGDVRADHGRGAAPAAPSCAGSASTSVFARTPTSPPGPGDPDDRLALGRLGRRDGDRAGGRGGRGLHRRPRVVPVLKHFPGPRLGAAGQPPDAAGADAHPQAADGRRPRALRRRRRAGRARRSWRATSTSAPIDPRVPASMSTAAGHRRAAHQLGFDGLVVTDSLSMAGVQGDVRRGALGRRRACAPATTCC